MVWSSEATWVIKELSECKLWNDFDSSDVIAIWVDDKASRDISGDHRSDCFEDIVDENRFSDSQIEFTWLRRELKDVFKERTWSRCWFCFRVNDFVNR